MLKDICMKKYNKEIKDCTNEEIYFALLDMTKKLADGKVSEEGQKKVIISQQSSSLESFSRTISSTLVYLTRLNRCLLRMARASMT